MRWPAFISRLLGERLAGPLTRGWLAGWLGNAGERAAARYLRQRGLTILARRYRTPLGELDLVAREGDCIVFVEVKTRRSAHLGQPFEAVDLRKQQQLTRLALAFLKRRGWLERKARFDVISIVWPDGSGQPQVAHFPHAFEATGRGQMFS